MPPRPVFRRLMRALGGACLLAAALPGLSQPLAEQFAREVERRLDPPAPARASYAARLEAALDQAGIHDPAPQFFLLVDRSAAVQAALLYWRSPGKRWEFVGAAPVSTGRPGEFEHFLTPLGVFAHSPANPDFRAEGTRNALGILGYGRGGMRVFDFGWTPSERGWGDGGTSPMRLQVHATDPDILEPLLGARRSRGCIRIPASLDVFLDRYGVLDADYEIAAQSGKPHWVLRADRQPTPWAGRWLVVVDSGGKRRPAWSRGPPGAEEAH